MKLAFRKERYKTEVVVETKYGDMPMRKFIEIERSKYPYNYTRLLADSNVDHSEFYAFTHGQSNSLRSIFLILDALGYDVQIVKRDGGTNI